MSSPYTHKELGPLSGWDGKKFGGQDLGLTGTEISFNRVGPGHFMPFVHAHKLNEEVYVVLQGGGHFFLDGQELPVTEGSVLRVSPPVARAWKAGGQGLTFVCIQAQAGSLTQATKGDGMKLESPKPSWFPA